MTSKGRRDVDFLIRAQDGALKAIEVKVGDSDHNKLRYEKDEEIWKARRTLLKKDHPDQWKALESGGVETELVTVSPAADDVKVHPHVTQPDRGARDRRFRTRGARSVFAGTEGKPQVPAPMLRAPLAGRWSRR